MGREVRQGRKKPIKGAEMNVVPVVGTWGTIPMGLFEKLRHISNLYDCGRELGIYLFTASRPWLVESLFWALTLVL